MTDEQLEELDEIALSTVQRCSMPHVLQEVLDKATMIDLWQGLGVLYMAKSIGNNIYLKEHLYTFSMTKGSPTQTHVDDFRYVIIDLKSLDMKLEDEDNPMLLVISLPVSYKRFGEFCYTVTVTICLWSVSTLICCPKKV